MANDDESQGRGQADKHRRGVNVSKEMLVEVEKIFLAYRRNDAARMKTLVTAAQERFGEAAVAVAWMSMVLEKMEDDEET